MNPQNLNSKMIAQEKFNRSLALFEKPKLPAFASFGRCSIQHLGRLAYVSWKKIDTRIFNKTCFDVRMMALELREIRITSDY